MNPNNTLVEAVIKGLQEKKGKKISIVDLTQIDGAISQYMIICEGNSTNHLSSLSGSVWDSVRIQEKEKPLSIDGPRNSSWIGMDYGTVLVHLFLPEQRTFYNLENLWADSIIEEVPDLN